MTVHNQSAGISLPADLIEELDRAAEADNRSRSGMARHLLLRALARHALPESERNRPHLVENRRGW